MENIICNIAVIIVIVFFIVLFFLMNKIRKDNDINEIIENSGFSQADIASYKEKYQNYISKMNELWEKATPSLERQIKFIILRGEDQDYYNLRFERDHSYKSVMIFDSFFSEAFSRTFPEVSLRKEIATEVFKLLKLSHNNADDYEYFVIYNDRIFHKKSKRFTVAFSVYRKRLKV